MSKKVLWNTARFPQSESVLWAFPYFSFLRVPSICLWGLGIDQVEADTVGEMIP
jgi:hypothetical protein